VALREKLGEVDLFRDMSAVTINEMIHRGTKFKVGPGRVLVEQGSTDSGLQLILEGSAVVSVNGVERGTLSEGEYFGEISLLDGAPRSATVVAGPEGVQTFALSSIAFSDLLDAHPDISRSLLKVLTARIRQIEARQG
jgi:CRP/FNR family transcriptional regulator, cyclic AMP receptor protein